MKIKIYTNPHCPYSEEAKKFFKKKKIEFEEISLFKNEAVRLEIIEKSGQMATPVIEFGDKLIVGFSENQIKELLQKKKE